MVRLMPLSPSILTRLKHQHEAISELIAGLSEQQLRHRVHPDKWSVFENIAHLAAYQSMFIGRLDNIAAQDAPSFDRYVAEKDPAFPDYLNTPLKDLLQLIPDKAAQITIRLTTLNEAGLLRVGIHPKNGRLTIPQWAQFYLLHEAHHLYTIFMLTQELRTASV
jgi:hypothetical protein